MTGMCDTVEWHHCYSGNYDLATPESNAHPAKAGWRLCFRIVEHLEELGLLHEGDTVLDFMAGTGRFLLAAGAKGYKTIAVELEPKFCLMLKDNREYASRKLGRELDMTIIQGDARFLSQLLQERGLVGVTSPPYAHDMKFDGEGKRKKILNGQRLGQRDDVYFSEGNKAWQGLEAGYGDTPGQIGNLKDKIVSITSPPYQDIEIGKGLNIKPPRSGRPDQTGRNPMSPSQIETSYSDNPANIGNCPDRVISITSPPYGEALEGGGISARMRGEGNYKLTTSMPGSVYQPSEHGLTPGQIGNLKDRVVSITSPPYAGGLGHGGQPTELDGRKHITGWVKDQYGNTPGQIENLPDKVIALTSPPYEDALTSSSQHGDSGIAAREPQLGNLGRYGVASKGQIGQEREEDYFSAMAKVYTEAYKVADVLVVVVKDPTRNKKLHPLGELTARLLEQCGWRICDYHFSLLFEEQEQGHLFEKPKKKVKGRLSFFKRLAYQKGSPVATGEHILICQR